MADLVCARNLTSVVILGDLTEAKDRHNAATVNRLVDGIAGISCPVYVLMGNHDYIDEATPYFGFLKHTKNVRYISKPMTLNVGDARVLFLPHTRKPEEVWFKYLNLERPTYQFILAHMTVTGARTPTGEELSGVSMKLVRKLGRPVISGDIHKQQTVGVVEYVGAPYDINFGDRSTRSAILFDAAGNRHDLRYPAPRKHVVRLNDPDDIAKCNFAKDDQVQVLLEVAIDDAANLPLMQKHITEAVAKSKATLVNLQPILQVSVEPQDGEQGAVVGVNEAFEAFVAKNNLSDGLIAAGRACLKQAGHNRSD